MFIILIILLASIIGFALFYASYSIRLGVYLKSICCNKMAGKVVSLTFDDGVDPVMTPKVLAVLKKYNISATFFIIGEKAEVYPHIVKQILDEGHIIGNHSYYHKGSFPTMSSKAIEVELLRTNKILKEISGEDVKYFRPPFGVTNPMIAKAVKRVREQSPKQQFTSIGWSIRSLDTLNKSREWVVQRVTKKLHNGAIILLHDNRPKADMLLENIIQEIQAKGYRIVGLEELISCNNNQYLK